MDGERRITVGIVFGEHVVKAIIDSRTPSRLTFLTTNGNNLVGSILIGYFLRNGASNTIPTPVILEVRYRPIVSNERITAIVIHETNSVVETTGSTGVVERREGYIAVVYAEERHRQTSGFRIGRLTQDLAMNHSALRAAIAIAATAGTYLPIVIGIQYREGEIAVGTTTPPPVDMEQVVSVIAIDHKGVSSSGRVAVVFHRSRCH